jgi:uncharacterized protein (TIGR00369 family)
MADAPPHHREQVPPVAILLGREWLGLDETTGMASYRFFARPEFANRHGTLQGGLLAAMLDSAAGYTLMSQLPAGLTALTNLDTAFLRPVPLGPIAINARIVARDERDAVVDAEVIDPAGQVLARATAKLRIRRRR